MVRILDRAWESSSWFKFPNKKKDNDFLYVVQSASLIAPLTAAYNGSTSTRGVRGVLGFLLRSVWRLRPGRGLEERVGVVDMFMSLGRMVPAMLAVSVRRGSAQCVEA